MNTKTRKSDSIGDEPKTHCLSSPKKITKKQIRRKTDKSMYVGIDLHKKFLQVAIMDEIGKVLQNKKVENTHQSIKQHFAKILISANIVMESSSVWYDTYRFLTDELGYKNVTLSNPCSSKKIVQYEIICVDLCVGVSAGCVLQLYYWSGESKDCKENALLLGNDRELFW